MDVLVASPLIALSVQNAQQTIFYSKITVLLPVL